MRNVLCAVALLVLFPAAAFADERFDKGSWELLVGLSAFDGLSPAIAYFVADNVEAIVHVDYHTIEIDYGTSGSNEEDAFEIGADFAYNFPTGGPIVPLVQGGVSYGTVETKTASVTDTDVDLWIVDVGAGVRLLIGTNASVNLLVDYGVGNADDNLSSLSGDFTGLDVALAYSLFF